MDNEYYMKKCIELANQAELRREIPVGAILVNENKIISQSHNLSINNNDPTAHAEINVIQDACKKYKNYRLNGFTLYVTLEPCIMCLGAICEARIGSVIFGAYSIFVTCPTLTPFTVTLLDTINCPVLGK